MSLLPPGSEQIAAWARARGLPYCAEPEQDWYRAWEPFWALLPPIRYYNAVQAQTGGHQIILVEPWYADDRLETPQRGLLAFVSHPGLRYRAAARIGASPLTRVAFLGELRPEEHKVGDPSWDQVAVTLAASPREAAAAFTPSLRKLLLGWSFVGHVELKVGGLVFHLDRARPVPNDCERVLNWAPMLLEKALKGQP